MEHKGDNLTITLCYNQCNKQFTTNRDIKHHIGEEHNGLRYSDGFSVTNNKTGIMEFDTTRRFMVDTTNFHVK